MTRQGEHVYIDRRAINRNPGRTVRGVLFYESSYIRSSHCYPTSPTLAFLPWLARLPVWPHLDEFLGDLFN